MSISTLNKLKALHTQVALSREIHPLDTLLGLTDAIRVLELQIHGESVTTVITPLVDNHTTYKGSDPIYLRDILKGLQVELQTASTDDFKGLLSSIHAIELYLYDEVITTRV